MINKKQFFSVFLTVIVSVCLVALAVSAATTVGNNVEVGGTTISNGDLSAGGKATTTAATGNFETQGTVYSIGNLMVGGYATVTAATGNIETQGTVYSIGNLMVGGYATVTAATGNFETQGTVYSIGNLMVGGYATVTAATGNIATEGTLTLGASGIAIAQHLSTSTSIDLPSINATSCATSAVSVQIAGVVAGDTVIASPTATGALIEAFPLVWSAYASSAANYVSLTVCSLGLNNGAAVNIGAQTWRFDVWQH